MEKLNRIIDEWGRMLARLYQDDLMRCKSIEEVNQINYAYGPLLSAYPNLERHSLAAKNRIHTVEMEKVKSWSNQMN